jgi:hypothetical protein
MFRFCLLARMDSRASHLKVHHALPEADEKQILPMIVVGSGCVHRKHTPNCM